MFEKSFIKKQVQKVEEEKEIINHAVQKLQISEAEEFEINHALHKKKQDHIKAEFNEFSQNDQHDIQEYISLVEEIDLMDKEINNKIEKNLDNGSLTLKLTRYNKLIARRDELDQHFKINPHIQDYFNNFIPINPNEN